MNLKAIGYSLHSTRPKKGSVLEPCENGDESSGTIKGGDHMCIVTGGLLLGVHYWKRRSKLKCYI
jgi:hypothetical protein